MKWTISTAIDSTIANSFLSRMHKSKGNLIIIIEKERLIREWSSQEKCSIRVLHRRVNKMAAAEKRQRKWNRNLLRGEIGRNFNQGTLVFVCIFFYRNPFRYLGHLMQLYLTRPFAVGKSCYMKKGSDEGVKNNYMEGSGSATIK